MKKIWVQKNLCLIFITEFFVSKKWVRKFWPQKIFLRRFSVRKNFMSKEILVQEKLWDQSKLLVLEPFKKFSAAGGIQRVQCPALSEASAQGWSKLNNYQSKNLWMNMLSLIYSKLHLQLAQYRSILIQPLNYHTLQKIPQPCCDISRLQE